LHARVGIPLNLLLACLSLSVASVAFPADQTLAVTRHTLALPGKPLQYTTEVGRLPIRDVETDEPHAYMGYTAYRATQTNGASPRPVTFIWNGGPGANSALLHFLVAGPRRYQAGRLVDNPQTWLAVSDLVMVDPVGTGFSRPAQSRYGTEFYNTRGDVASVTEFVRAWRLLHGAEDAPVFLVGESWGAGRAAAVAYALESRGITVNGLVLISGGWGLTHEYGDPTLRDALRVVDMASTALYYGKTPAALGRNPDSVRAAAEKWVRETYAPALSRIDRLTEPERAEIIEQLSQYSGIPPVEIDPRTIKLSPRHFRESILKNEGQIPSPFDLRERQGERPAFIPAVILRYFRHELNYPTDLPYVDLEPLEQGFAPGGRFPEPVGEQWNYATIDHPTEEQVKSAIDAAQREGGGPPHIGPLLPATESALALNPRMRILVAAGMYDGFQPCAAGAEIASTLPENLKAAITFKCYAGGHAMYLDEPVRRQLSADVAALLTSGH
jgi:carboxypeptidase C (cathepsin A)